MRIALVSPYSWTYPGGVTRHIEALAEQSERGRPRRPHPDPVRSRRSPQRAPASRRRARSRASSRRGRGRARAHGRPAGERRGLERRALAGGGVPAARRAARRRLRRRPRARADRARDLLGRGRRRAAPRSSAPSTPTRPTASRTTSATSPARVGASTGCTCGSRSRGAAAWTGERFFGGRYRVIPNGVEVPDARACAPAAAEPTRASGRCGSRSSARRSSARGCRWRCAAFEALREHIPVTFDLVGVEPRADRAR